MSEEPIIYVDPLTFKITEVIDPDPRENYTRQLLRRVIKNVREKIDGKNEVEKLKIINDEISLLLNKQNSEWNKIPSDTRFPGFFSSLADHALATCTVAVTLALDGLAKKADLSEGYNGETKELLSSKKGVLEVTRLLSFLHDSGKPPDREHVEKTKEFVTWFLGELGFKSNLTEQLSKSASKHHYGRWYRERKEDPKTKLEWIIAYADKIAVQDRVLNVKELDRLSEALVWLSKYSHLNDEDRKKVDLTIKLIDKLSKNEKIDPNSENWEEMNRLLPLDPDLYRNKLDRELLNVHDKLGFTPETCFILLEGQGVQKYIRNSEANAYMVGASSLIEVATKRFTRGIVDETSKESIIYSASGSILCLAPEFTLCSIMATHRDLVSFVDSGMGFKGPADKVIKAELFPLKEGPCFAWDLQNRNLKELIERRCFGEFYKLTLNTIKPYKVPTKGLGQIPIGEICNICYEDRVSEDQERINKVKGKMPEDEKENFRPCTSCLRVYEHYYNLKDPNIKFIAVQVDEKGEVKTGEKDWRAIEERVSAEVEDSPLYSLKELIQSALIEKLSKHPDLKNSLKGKTVNLVPIKTWNLLGKQSKGLFHKVGADEVLNVAFVKGDGDDFGKIKSSMSNITAYRRINEIFKRVIQGSVAEGLAEVLAAFLEQKLKNNGAQQTINLYLPFEVVFVGGDDFMLVLDAGFLPHFLKGLREEVVRTLGSRTKGEYEKEPDSSLSYMPLGLSLGVVVAQNRAPVYAVLEALGELLSKAKEKSKVESGEESVYGAEIFVALQRFTGIPLEDDVRENYEGNIWKGGSLKVHRTAWPKSGSEIFDDMNGKAGLFKLTKELLKAGIRANNVANVVSMEEKSGEASKLVVRYKAARITEDNSKKKGYQLLAENLYVPEKTQNDECNKSVSLRFQHLDVANIMKMVHDRPELLPGG
ncbi:MAG: hypothetical protein JRJ77_07385 [Deltaproteobacteria bacterium]|nr:hypothetical protein [Deltaproteobacteria bacterium]